jgi:Holliday junction resolvase RusA-like endonuclease
MLPDNWVLAHRDVVEIEPIGKGRPRTVRRGRYSHTYTPEKTKRFEEKLAFILRGKLSVRTPPVAKAGQPVMVSILAVHSRPKNMYRAADSPDLIWKCTRPDADNIGKACCDAIEKAGNIIDNDAQIVLIEVGKAYAEKDGKARIEIEIFTLAEDSEQ